MVQMDSRHSPLQRTYLANKNKKLKYITSCNKNVDKP